MGGEREKSTTEAPRPRGPPPCRSQCFGCKADVNRCGMDVRSMSRGPMQMLADEVRGQPEALEEFEKSEFPRAPKGSIFAGAGDSYAASLAAFYSSGGRCLAL